MDAPNNSASESLVAGTVSMGPPTSGSTTVSYFALGTHSPLRRLYCLWGLLGAIKVDGSKLAQELSGG